MNADGLRARCSHCDYARRFSPELGGKYFRCPKCRQGVLAVPRASAGSQDRWRTSEERWLSDDGSKARDSRLGASSKADPSETPEGIVVGARAAKDAPGAGPGRASRGGALAETLADPELKPKASKAAAVDEASGAEPPSADGKAASEDDAKDNRGEVATVRRIIVECGLCGFMVKIPPAFFGKTVHCPECAGDTVFSESALEPVKDELVDRMALDTAERDALFKIDAARQPKWTTLRSFLVGVALGLVAILGIWGFLRAKRNAGRDAQVQHALREGWRWATDERDPMLLHEPWCRELVRIDQRVSEDERPKKKNLAHHPCD